MLKTKTMWGILRFPFILLWILWRAVWGTLKLMWAFYRTPVGAVIVLVALIGTLSFALATGARIYDRSLEAQVEASLVAKIDKHSTFKRDFERPRASTTPNEFMEVGGPTWLREKGIEAILVEAKIAGFDTTETAVLLATADRESGFNPLAKAKSTSACGLFQFIPETGKRHGLPVSRCMNPRANARAQARHFKGILSKVRSLDGLDEEERLVVMFRETYCKHHDGENSTGCSTTASAVVAEGLDILFASEKELRIAEGKRSSSPRFLKEVVIVLQETIATARDTIEPFMAKVAQTQ